MTAGVALGESGLTVPLPSGRRYFNYCWLRDICASGFDAETRERVFDISILAALPAAQEAWIESGCLHVAWRDEALVSTFELAWLDAWACDPRRDDPARLPRQPWYADAYPAFARFDFAALCSDDSSRMDWARTLIVDGIALVSGMPDSDDALTALARQLGCVRPSVAGDYFDVRVHASPVNLSYTAAALEMHTDTPAEELPPGVQFLHCRANTVAGGDSLFLDGAAVAEDFRTVDPDGFRLLAETKVPFFYEHDDFDWRSRQRVIELDADGAVSGLTISRHMADTLDMSQQDMDAYYPALWRFGRLLRDPKYVVRFRLNAGECIVFDNHRVVHGREAYENASGERYLRGCYVDRGELRSTYRTLARKAAVPAQRRA